MKFEESKKLSAIDILKLLQDMTNQNLSIMKNNNDLIVRLSKSHNLSVEKIKKLREKYYDNNLLFKHNKDYLDLHDRLLSFLKSLDQSISLQVDAILMEKKDTLDNIDIWKDDIENVLHNTVTGGILFNEQHPFFQDSDFRNKLIEYYSKREEYEKCIELIKADSTNY